MRRPSRSATSPRRPTAPFPRRAARTAGTNSFIQLATFMNEFCRRRSAAPHRDGRRSGAALEQQRSFTMRKLLISAALATATVAAAVPTAAMAQPGYGWQNRRGVDRAQVNGLLRDL